MNSVFRTPCARQARSAGVEGLVFTLRGLDHFSLIQIGACSVTVDEEEAALFPASAGSAVFDGNASLESGGDAPDPCR